MHHWGEKISRGGESNPMRKTDQPVGEKRKREKRPLNPEVCEKKNKGK